MSREKNIEHSSSKIINTNQCVCNMEWRGINPGDDMDDCQCWELEKNVNKMSAESQSACK